MSITGTVPVSDPIAPTSELDTYPVTNPKYGLGGLRSVATIAERDAITNARREVGMLVYVSNLNKYYSLTGGVGNSNWYEFSSGSGGMGVTGPTGPKGDRGETGSPGLAPTNYVASLNSLTGPLQISAGENVQITVQGSNTLVITALEATFDSDITASFGLTNTFGKYLYGQRVPALGRTALQVIEDALQGTLPPTLSITSPSSVLWNQTIIQNQLNLSHAIQTIGATGVSGFLEFRRSNTGWFPLGSNFFNSSGSTFAGVTTHTFTETIPYNQNDFFYRYTVIDSKGASAQATLQITGGRDLGVNVGLSVVATDGIAGGSIEDDFRRERGNYKSNVSASIVQRNRFVPVSGWIAQYNINNTGWISWTSGTLSQPPAGQTAAYNIVMGTHTPPLNNNNTFRTEYRIQVTDGGSPGGKGWISSSVLFDNLIWYGATGQYPTVSNNIRNNGLIAFNPRISANNPFLLDTGVTATRFVVAIPSPRILTQASDAAGNNFLPFFVTGNAAWSGLSQVNNKAGVPVNYNVYTFPTSIPFNDGRTPPNGIVLTIRRDQDQTQ